MPVGNCPECNTVTFGQECSACTAAEYPCDVCGQPTTDLYMCPACKANCDFLDSQHVEEESCNCSECEEREQKCQAQYKKDLSREWVNGDPCDNCDQSPWSCNSNCP